MNDFTDLIIGILIGLCVAYLRLIISAIKIFNALILTIGEARKVYTTHFIKGELEQHLKHIQRRVKAEKNIKVYVLESELTFTEKILMMNQLELSREKHALDLLAYLDSQKKESDGNQ